MKYFQEIKKIYIKYWGVRWLPGRGYLPVPEYTKLWLKTIIIRRKRSRIVFSSIQRKRCYKCFLTYDFIQPHGHYMTVLSDYLPRTCSAFTPPIFRFALQEWGTRRSETYKKERKRKNYNDKV